MRVLLVTYAYPPLITPRAIQLARLVKYLTRLKISVHVLAAKPGFTSEAADQSLLEIYRPQEGFFRVSRTPTIECSYVSQGLGLIHPGLNWLPDPKAGWRPFALREAKRLVSGRGYDALLTCSLPYTSHLVGLGLKERFGLPWVAHLSDPWTLSPYVRFLGARHRRLVRGWERRVLEAADRVVFVSRTTRDAYRGKYPFLEGKDRLIRHCFDPEEPASGAARKDLDLVHVGHFYGKRSPAALFRALASLDSRRLAGVRFVFAGRVGPRDLKEAERLGLGRVIRFLGPVPYRDAAGLMDRAKNFLLVDAASRERSHFFPSKLVDYLARGRPVVGLTPSRGEAAEALGSLGQPTVEPDDVEGISGLILKALDGALAPPDREQVLSAYSAKVAAREMAGVLEEALSRA